MVAGLIEKTGSWSQRLSFNWFDIALFGVLVFSVVRGRRRGMTKELFPMLQWFFIAVGAGFGHLPLANWLQREGYIRAYFGYSFHEHTEALMSAYLGIAAVVFFLFTFLQRRYEPRLEGSNTFGGNEYYWGVVASVLRSACLVLVGLALLNGPYFSPAEIQAIKQAKLDNFAGGGHVKGMEHDSGDFIPSIYEVQDSIFKESVVGPLIKDHLSVLLISSLVPVQKPVAAPAPKTAAEPAPKTMAAPAPPAGVKSAGVNPRKKPAAEPVIMIVTAPAKKTNAVPVQKTNAELVMTSVAGPAQKTNADLVLKTNATAVPKTNVEPMVKILTAPAPKTNAEPVKPTARP